MNPVPESLTVATNKALHDPKARAVVPGFLMIFLPVFLVTAVIGVWYAQRASADAIEGLAQPQRQSLDVAARTGEDFLIRPIRNLRGLAELQTDVKAALDGKDSEATPVLQQFFYDLLVRNPDFAQMRWIGDDGRERVRVDVQADQLPTVSTASQLQDKHDRPYVVESLHLPAGALYVSPLDLNVEHGRVETPFRPEIRLAMRVFADTGMPRGLFVLNVDGQALLNQFHRTKGASVPLQLLDTRGHWLQGERPEQSWGFMFGHTDTLAAQSPQAWQRISAQVRGQVELPDGLWTWETCEPVPANARFQGTLQWKLVTRIPAATLASLRSQARWATAAAGGLVLLLAGFVCWVVATLNERRRAADRQSIQALQRASEGERARDDLLKFLRNVTDNLPTMVAYWNSELRLTFANRAYAEWFSRTVESVRDVDRVELLGEDLTRQNEGFVQGALDGKEQQFERAFERPNGTLSHTLNRYIPDRDEHGVKGFIAVTVDVTDLKDAQLRLQELNVQLEHESLRALSASRAKSEFLSNMSHEIRTPMNGILGLCYLMEKEDLPAAARGMMQRIRGAGRALLELINEILDFSKIEAGRLETERVPFRLADVLDNLATVLSSTNERKPVEVIVGPPPPGADWLEGDPLRLGQVLINLASNAVKFTRQGEVVVRVTRLDPAPGDPPAGRVRLRFSVRDTGIGIAAAKLEAIFQPFSQADSSTTRQYGGTGLGLAISRHLVALMGGRLCVQSTPGQGSEFHFDLVLATSRQFPAQTPGLTQQRVLIADDQPTAREVLVEIAASLGWHGMGVDSGQAVLHTLSQNARQFDVLLLDWRMPDLDGLAVARELRTPDPAGHMPIIIMVTAFDRDQLLSEAYSGLVDAVLSKPVTPSALFNAVSEAMKRRSAPGGTPAPRKVGHALEGLRILVVDDSDLNRDVAVNILEDEGAVVDTATDGMAALDLLHAQPRGFQVVLMDMQMPAMDGYEATRRIRATPGLEDLRVIALTAGAFREQRALALAAGVDEFVSKPFEVAELLETIQRLAGRDTQQANLVRAGSDGRNAQVLNVARGAGLWTSRQAYVRALDRFLQAQVAAVQQMASTSVSSQAALAHRLRGVAGQLGIEVVAGLAGEVEDGLRSGVDVRGYLVQLEQAMAAAVQAIDSFKALDASEPADRKPESDDSSKVLARLDDLLHALDSDDIAPVEAALSSLQKVLDPQSCKPLRRACAEFDFRGAEVLARKLAARLAATLGN